ncbi:helix-turn-helix transcriptional regulator [Paenibacillus sp. IB182496]|uniref:Helix-turn-helix transcriptional regulator n=1 Tax=Paenibacillus sabuli TaxID=2772509 RepID=A0A927GTD2_9BACL|nr:AraC family transcriptional regulator [Paenibacillus sabuli]MBD2846602.1 helix-turn-helix transcriptional regulator [Paenibacillus sabuli]
MSDTGLSTQHPEQAIRIRRHLFHSASTSGKLYVSHCFKIVWVRQGEAVWRIGGLAESIHSGDIVLLGNEEKRRFERVSAEQPLELMTMELEPRYLYDTGLLPLFTEAGAGGQKHRIVAAGPALTRLLELVDREERSPDGYSRVMLAACAAQILTGIARRIELPAGRRAVIPPRMAAAIAHIDAHFGRPIRLEELARIAHMSPTAFSKAFTRTNGVGPAQYIKRKRIGQAIRLLEETDRTVLDIALECGFANISNFYKAFHSLTGQAPGDYRGGP